MIIEYTGPSDVRVIRDTDFALVGITNSTVVWNKANGFEVEVVPAVAAFLLAFGSEFKNRSTADTLGNLLAGGIQGPPGVLNAISPLNLDLGTKTMDIDVGLGDTDVASGNGPINPTNDLGVSYRRRDLDAIRALISSATSASPLDIIWIGDSLGISTSCWKNVVRGAGSLLANQLGTPASLQLVPTQGVTNGTGTGHGVGAGAVSLTNGQTVTWPSERLGPIPVKSLRVVFTAATGAGTLTFSDDYSSRGAVNTSGTAKGSKVTVLTLDPNHPLEGDLVVTSTGNCTIESVFVDTGSAVRIWNVSSSGYSSNAFVTDTTLGMDLLASLKDAAWANLKGIVVATGANDDPNIPTWIDGLLSAIDSVKPVGSQVVQWLPYASAAINETYVDALRQDAISDGRPIIDPGLIGRWVAKNSTIDGIHPSGVGIDTLAVHVAAELSGDPLGTMVMAKQSINIDPDTMNVFGMSTSPALLVSSYTILQEAEHGILRVTGLAQLPVNSDGMFQGGFVSRPRAAASGAYTFAVEDLTRIVVCSDATKKIVTIPKDLSGVLGARLQIVNTGAGQFVIKGATGTTVDGRAAGCVTPAMGSMATIVQVATNVWASDATAERTLKVLRPNPTVAQAFVAGTVKLIPELTATLPFPASGIIKFEISADMPFVKSDMTAFVGTGTISCPGPGGAGAPTRALTPTSYLNAMITPGGTNGCWPWTGYGDPTADPQVMGVAATFSNAQSAVQLLSLSGLFTIVTMRFFG